MGGGTGLNNTGPYTVSAVTANTVSFGYNHADYALAADTGSVKVQKGICPSCKVRDLTIRYNWSYNTEGGPGIFNSHDRNCSSGQNCSSQGMFNLSVHDNLHDYVHLPQGSGGDGVELLSDRAPFSAVTFFHNTITSDTRSAFEFGSVTPIVMTNLIVRDNIVHGGSVGWINTGAGGCQRNLGRKPSQVLNGCASPYTFNNNAFIGDFVALGWPTGNLFPAGPANILFVNYNNGNGGNYQLQARSRYHNAATDGTDLGANIDLVNQNVGTQY